jgi:hypothetical protein
LEVEAGRVRRKQPMENGASRGLLHRGRSSLAVLEFKKPRDVADADRRRASQGEEGAEEEHKSERNGGKLGVHGWSWRRSERSREKSFIEKVCMVTITEKENLWGERGFVGYETNLKAGRRPRAPNGKSFLVLSFVLFFFFFFLVVLVGSARALGLG